MTLACLQQAGKLPRRKRRRNTTLRRGARTSAVLSQNHILIECPAIAAQRREYLQSSLQGREINVLNFLGEGGPIRDVLRFLREVNLSSYRLTSRRKRNTSLIGGITLSDMYQELLLLCLISNSNSHIMTCYTRKLHTGILLSQKMLR